MTAKRILFVVSEDWVFMSHRFHLAEYAAAQGMRVTIMCNLTKYTSVFRKAGFEVIDWKLNRGAKNPVILTKDLLRTRYLINQQPWDIVHVVAIKPIILIGLISFYSSAFRKIYCVTGLGFIFTSERLPAKLLRPIVSVLFKSLLSRANCDVVVQNKDDQIFFEKKIGIPSSRLHMIKGAGVDIHRFVLSREPQGIPVVSLPARLLIDKGVFEFVEVARIVNRKERRATFKLLGSPDTQNPNSISDDSLKDWHEEGVVDVAGYHHDMPSALQGSHVICFPSYREGLPKALLEACACGKPIVAFDVPGVREIVKHKKNGYLVALGDISAMAKCVDKLISDQNLRMEFGKAGRSMVESEFGQSTVQEQFGQLWSRKS